MRFYSRLQRLARRISQSGGSQYKRVDKGPSFLSASRRFILRRYLLSRVVIVLACLAAASSASALALATPNVLVSNTAGTGTSTDATTQTVTTSTEPYPSALLEETNRKIVKYRGETWHCQHLTGHSRTRSHYKPDGSNTLEHAQAVLRLWHGRAVRWQKIARRWMRNRILEYRRNVGHWRLVMGQPALGRTLAASANLEEQLRHWRRASNTTYLKLTDPPPSLSDWMCIHSGIKGGRWSRSLRYLGGGYKVSNGEGSWTDSGSPYWGGLQMDLTFQKTYGGWLFRHKGTADHWTAYEQIWAAVKAYRTRGFGPWPVTGRDCGL